MIVAKAKACRVEKTLILMPLKGTLVATRERTLMTRHTSFGIKKNALVM